MTFLGFFLERRVVGEEEGEGADQVVRGFWNFGLMGFINNRMLHVELSNGGLVGQYFSALANVLD